MAERPVEPQNNLLRAVNERQSTKSKPERGDLVAADCEDFTTRDDSPTPSHPPPTQTQTHAPSLCCYPHATNRNYHCFACC